MPNDFAMDSRNYSFTSEDENKRKKMSLKKQFGIGVLAVMLGACVGTLLFYLINGNSFGLTKDSGNDFPDPDPSCSIIKDEEKFNCHPDWPISEKECHNRGCCYRAASDLKVSDSNLIDSSYLGVPSCFYPSNYAGYNISDITADNSKISADLTRLKASGFHDDIKNLKLTISFIDDNSIRLVINDANPKSARFIPDIGLNYNIKERKNELYLVNLTSDGSLLITRKSSGAIVFQTELSRLVYSDQFLQISSYTASKYLYGFGEHKEGILKSFNWNRLTLFNQGDLPVPNRNLYGTHPFYLVVEPGGDTNGVFLFNSNAMDALLQPTPAITLRSIGGILDLFIMLGPTPADVVKQYTNIVGRTFMPPYWSLGFHICKYGYFSLNKTVEVLERNLDEDIPIDVQWHDIDFMHRNLDFTYDPVNFKGLPEFVEKLHNDGRHYVAMISPGVSDVEETDSYAPYDEGRRLDLFVKDINGSYIHGKVWNTNYTVFPDFSNPKTPPYWAKQFEDYHAKLHWDGIWIDMNEPLNFLNGSDEGCPTSPLEDPQYLPGRPYPLRTLTLCMTAKHLKTEHYNEHNLLGYREAHATYNAIKDVRKKRPFIISRATFSGQGQWSGHWSGDITSNWEDMRYTIPSMLMFNFYGMSMIGSDICGFRENVTTELCARWQSLGAFYPFSRNHNDYDTFEQDPAAMGPDVINATKNSLLTRYYLLPYLYTLFYRSHVFGETVVRPLFFEFPDDVNTYSIEEEFLWGPSLMILPILYESAVKVDAYFPKGVWYDFYSGKAMKSKGEKFALEANITHINVAVRGGAILPLQLPGKTTVESRTNAFDLLVALDENSAATGELYWDDGDSLDTYVKENYNLITFSATNNVTTTKILKRNYISLMNLNEVKLFGIDTISSAAINSQNVQCYSNMNYWVINATGFSLLDELTISWT